MHQGRCFLVGDAFTVADLSVFPRVAMYPLVQLPIDAERYPALGRWMARLGDRPSVGRSEGVRQ